jgi:hypothetical protein
MRVSLPGESKVGEAHKEREQGYGAQPVDPESYGPEPQASFWAMDGRVALQI